MTSTLLTNRYRLLHLLGAGGMGAVYQAYDRLSGEMVALKRLAGQPFATPASTEQRLALAREFQVLAGLRHPHIVAVRDYGFVQETNPAGQAGQPYFSMELLPQAATLVTAGQMQTTAGKLNLLGQLLSALIYVHRRQLIHRDLKPGNVLVIGNTVKLLDFGLATFGGQHVESAGTLAYMAPELLRGASASLASDLYAVGVLAYELFAGWHPFADNLADLRMAIVQQEPDFTYVELDPPLVAVLQRLLAKDPSARYASAAAVMAALSAATGQAPPAESVTIRESFLQAAPLIGRERELATLLTALEQAQNGQGSSWLVGGESGIGKSRLLQELRTRGLVQGFVALRGQANSTSNGPYDLWRASLRQLVLLADPSDLEAAILRPLVPDLGDLLERTIGEAPLVDPQSAQTRLQLTVAALLRRGAQQQPILLLLEDLHWADANSLEVLRWLTQQVTPLPILLVATYRRDEEPRLAEKLPEFQQLALGRLAPEQVARLSEAMLGSEGKAGQLVAFLQQQSEGNTFFMVEIMRALAAEAGRLDQVAQMTLPQQLFAGGIQQLVERRLQRVSAQHQLPLRLAAVAGRQLDLTLLHALEPHVELDGWLTECANAAVLELTADALHWHFSHDKLREGILRVVSREQRRADHARIGATLATIYAPALAPHYADLAYHYGQAEQAEQECHYLQLAASAAQASYANTAAIGFYERLLQVTTQRSAQLLTLTELGNILRLVGRWAEAEARYGTALALANQLGDGRAHAFLLRALGSLSSSRSDQRTALTWLEQAQAEWLALADSAEVSATHNEMGLAYHQLGEYAQATQHLAESLRLARALDQRELMAAALHSLGRVAQDQGDYAAMQSHFAAALTLFRATGNRPRLAATLNNLGNLARMQGDFVSAETFYRECLTTRREIGDKHGLASVLNNLGILAQNQRDYTHSSELYAESLALRRELGDRQGTAIALANIGTNAHIQGDYAQAQQIFGESLALFRSLNNRLNSAVLLYSLGEVALAQDEFAPAQHYYHESLTLLRAIGDKQNIALVLTGLAAIALRGAGNARRAIRLASVAHTLLTVNQLVIDPITQSQFEQTIAQARAALGEAAFTAAWSAGSAMSLAEALAEALGERMKDEG